MHPHPITPLSSRLARRAAPLAGAALLASACSEPATSPAGPGVAINVAPLSLPNIAYACYDLRVVNDLEQTVWSQGTSTPEGQAPSICSSQYGNAAGGDVTYIGTCDATDNDPLDAGVAQNTVTLWVDGLYDEDGEDVGDYQNPCPWPNGCTLAFDCLENADVEVPFDLTIMRQAYQGFFDVAVSFDDIFCSAKVDCQYDDGESVKLLYGKDGALHPSVAVAFACSAGEDADTHLYLDTLFVNCEDPGTGQVMTLATIDPSEGPGNVFATPKGPPIVGQPSPDDAEVVWQYAVYQGTAHDDEVLYWNLGLGLNLAPAPAGWVCYLDAIATASDGPLPGGATPVDATYPVIQFHVALNPDGTPALACGQNPLNGGPPIIEGLTAPADPGVSTAYSAPGQPECFDGGMTYHAISDLPVGFDAGCGVTTRVFHDVDLDGAYDPAIDLVHPDTQANLYVYRVDDPTTFAGGGLFAGDSHGLTTFTKYGNNDPFVAGQHVISLRRVHSTLPCPPDTAALIYGHQDVELALDPAGSYLMEFPYACVPAGFFVGGDDVHGIKARVFEDVDGDLAYTPGLDVLTEGQPVAMVLEDPWDGGAFHVRSAMASSDANGIALLSKYNPGGFGYPGQPLLLDVNHALVLLIGANGYPLPAQCTHGAEVIAPSPGVRPPPFGTDLIVDMPYRCLPAPPPTPGPVTVFQYHDANRNGTYEAGVDPLAGSGHGLYVVSEGARHADLVSDASGGAVLAAYANGPLVIGQGAGFHTGPQIGGLLAPCPAGFSYAVIDDPGTASNERLHTFVATITAAPQTLYRPTGCMGDGLFPAVVRAIGYHDRNANGVYDAAVDVRVNDGRGVTFQQSDAISYIAYTDGTGVATWTPVTFHDARYKIGLGACPAGFVLVLDPPLDWRGSTPVGTTSATVFVSTGCVGLAP